MTGDRAPGASTRARRKTTPAFVRTRLAMAVEQAQELIALCDRGGRVTYVNAATARMFAYEPEAVLGRLLVELIRSGAHAPAFYAEFDHAIAAGQGWSGHVVTRRSDGSLLEIEASIQPIRDVAGEVVGIACVGRDRTRQQALEAQRHQADKMEAVSRLAGGLAHDFNNVLTAIGGFAALARAEAADDRSAADLTEIERLTTRAGDLTRQLLVFARRTPTQSEPVDVNEVVRRAASMLEQVIGADVGLRLDLDPRPAIVLSDIGQLQQVVVNLAVNARDAMPGGGIVTISTRHEDLDASRVADRPGLVPGPHVILTVRDTGVGIADDALPRIFDPFYTTKDVVAGAGLGLASVYGIVKAHQGAICVDTEVGVGTTMTVSLPELGGGASRRRSAPRDPVQIGRAGHRILVIDDEPTIRDLVSRILRRAGHAVTVAASAEDAIGQVEAGSHDLELIVTDIVMPGLSGPDAVQRLRVLVGDVPVVMMSGYLRREDNPEAVAHSVWLGKPFTAGQLIEQVNAGLALGLAPGLRS